MAAVLPSGRLARALAVTGTQSALSIDGGGIAIRSPGALTTETPVTPLSIDGSGIAIRSPGTRAPTMEAAESRPEQHRRQRYCHPGAWHAR
jgi:hypothetical protein